MTEQNTPRPKVFQFHKITREFEFGGTNNTPQQFEAFIKMIVEAGYTPIVPSDLDKPSGPRPVIISFDDGYHSLYDHALPILLKHGVKALVFLITGFIGRVNSWDFALFGHREQHLNWPEIEAMRQAGIEFGSHTVTHADLTRLTDEQLNHELRHSKKVIEDRIGRIDSISFPFNRTSERVKATAARSGYRYGFGGFTGNSFPMAIYKDAVYITDNRRSLRVKLTESPRLAYRYECAKSRIINLFSMTTELVRRYG